MRASSAILRAGFSLIEVVIATAVFATAIVAIIGLMSPLSRRVEDVIDSETAARLGQSIEAELSRIGFPLAVTLTNGVSLELVANERGDRVLISSGATPAADNELDHLTLPGIAERDRYFRIILSRQVAYNATNSGSLALRADVVWPYRLPQGPASTTTNAVGGFADPSVLTADSSRQSLAFFFALTP